MIWLTAGGGAKRPEMLVRVDDVLERSSIGICGQPGHMLRMAVASVCVFSPDKGVDEVAVEVTFCPTCARFYILDDDFDRLSTLGAICCQVIPHGRKPGVHTQYVGPGLADQAFFKSLGYPTGRRDDLPAAERRAVLDFAIVNGFRSREATTSFIRWLIEFNTGRKGTDDAMSRWSDDLAYLESDRHAIDARLALAPAYLAR